MRPARRRSDAPFLQYFQGHGLGKSQLQRLHRLQAGGRALASFEAIGAHALQLIFGDQVWIISGHQIHLTPAIRLRSHVQQATFAPWRAIGIPLTLQGTISSPHFRMAGITQRCPNQHTLRLGKGTLWLLLGTAGISIAVAHAEATALEGGQGLFTVTGRFRIAPRHQGKQQQQRPHEDDAQVADTIKRYQTRMTQRKWGRCRTYHEIIFLSKLCGLDLHILAWLTSPYKLFDVLELYVAARPNLSTRWILVRQNHHKYHHCSCQSSQAWLAI